MTKNQDPRKPLKAAIPAVLLCLFTCTAGTRGEPLPSGHGRGGAGDPDPLVYILQSRDIQPYRAALEGFLGEMDSARRGIRTGVQSLEDWEAPDRDLLAHLRETSPDLVVTLGSSATRALVGEIPEIPIVFSLVLMSSSRGLLDRARRDGIPVTGVGMDIPIRVQFQKAREMLPGLRRIGVFYDPQQTATQIREAERVAGEMRLKLVDLPVRSEGDLLGRLEGDWPEVDLLWSVADSTVFTPRSTHAILLETLRRKIPFLGLSPSFVKAGALLSFSCDYREVGALSARTALKVLGGEPAQHLPMIYPSRVSLHLNLKTARKIGLVIPREIRQQADSVFGSSP